MRRTLRLLTSFYTFIKGMRRCEDQSTTRAVALLFSSLSTCLLAVTYQSKAKQLYPSNRGATIDTSECAMSLAYNSYDIEKKMLVTMVSTALISEAILVSFLI